MQMGYNGKRIHLLAAVQLLNSSLQRFSIGVGDGSEATELSSVVVSWECDFLDLAVLLDNGAEDHLIDTVGDVALGRGVRWRNNLVDKINVGLLDENFVRHVCSL